MWNNYSIYQYQQQIYSSAYIEAPQPDGTSILVPRQINLIPDPFCPRQDNDQARVYNLPTIEAQHPNFNINSRDHTYQPEDRNTNIFNSAMYPLATINDMNMYRPPCPNLDGIERKSAPHILETEQRINPQNITGHVYNLSTNEVRHPNFNVNHNSQPEDRSENRLILTAMYPSTTLDDMIRLYGPANPPNIDGIKQQYTPNVLEMEQRMNPEHISKHVYNLSTNEALQPNCNVNRKSFSSLPEGGNTNRLNVTAMYPPATIDDFIGMSRPPIPPNLEGIMQQSTPNVLETEQRMNPQNISRHIYSLPTSEAGHPNFNINSRNRSSQLEHQNTNRFNGTAMYQPIAIDDLISKYRPPSPPNRNRMTRQPTLNVLATEQKMNAQNVSEHVYNLSTNEARHSNCNIYVRNCSSQPDYHNINRSNVTAMYPPVNIDDLMKMYRPPSPPNLEEITQHLTHNALETEKRMNPQNITKYVYNLPTNEARHANFDVNSKNRNSQPENHDTNRHFVNVIFPPATSKDTKDKINTNRPPSLPNLCRLKQQSIPNVRQREHRMNPQYITRKYKPSKCSHGPIRHRMLNHHKIMKVTQPSTFNNNNANQHDQKNLHEQNIQKLNSVSL